jgi:hypothetical protein
VDSPYLTLQEVTMLRCSLQVTWSRNTDNLIVAVKVAMLADGRDSDDSDGSDCSDGSIVSC